MGATWRVRKQRGGKRVRILQERLQPLLQGQVSGRLRAGQPVAPAAEAPPVVRRREPHAPGEQAAEVAGILAAAFGGDRLAPPAPGLGRQSGAEGKSVSRSLELGVRPIKKK